MLVSRMTMAPMMQNTSTTPGSLAAQFLRFMSWWNSASLRARRDLSKAAILSNRVLWEPCQWNYLIQSFLSRKHQGVNNHCICLLGVWWVGNTRGWKSGTVVLRLVPIRRDCATIMHPSRCFQRLPKVKSCLPLGLETCSRSY